MFRNIIRKHARNSMEVGGLMILGDVICQTYVEKKALKEVDTYRALKFGAIGAVYVGPIISTWYRFLERAIVFKSAGLQAVGKMAVDQIFLAPTFLYSFLWINGLTSFKPVDEVKREAHKNYFDILITNYKVWPFVQVFNFWVVPLRYRVIFVQVIAIFWNTYLSYMLNRK